MADGLDLPQRSADGRIVLEPNTVINDKALELQAANFGATSVYLYIWRDDPPPQPDRCEVSFSGWDAEWFQCTLPDDGHEWHSADISEGTLTFRVMKGC